MSGTMVEFPVNGTQGSGYLAVPESGKGPGVIVIQEWWGLVPHIKDVCDRFAKAGYTALAPDLYHGKTTTSPDDAGKLMMALNIGQAEKDLRASIQYLLGREECSSSTVGTVGFCMGGQLSLFAACANPQVGACVIFYGIHPEVKPDIPSLKAPVLGNFAENDEMVPPSAVNELEKKLKDAGKEVDFKIYSGADHAFFNDTGQHYSEKDAKDAWERTLKFYEKELK